MKKLPAINSLVVFNHLPDAAVFRVVETKAPFRVGVIDRSLESMDVTPAVQWVDVSMILMPTLRQLSSLN